MPFVMICLFLVFPWFEIQLGGTVHTYLRQFMSSGQAYLAIVLWFFLMFSLGIRLAKNQGLKLFLHAQLQLQQGRLPEYRLIEALLIALGALALALPGFASDLLGFCLFIPGLRRLLAQALQRRWERKVKVVHFSSFHTAPWTPQERNHDTSLLIDVEARDLSPHESKPRLE